MRKTSSFLPSAASSTRLQQAREAIQQYVQKNTVRSYECSTRKGYTSDWRIFHEWCVDVGHPALPATPETVALFLAAQAHGGFALATLDRRLTAIRFAHYQAGLSSPRDSLQVAMVLRGIRNARGRHEPRRKIPMDDEVYQMADAADASALLGLRDRAILLFVYAGGLRRTELVRLDVDCVKESDEGLSVRVARPRRGEGDGGRLVVIRRVPSSRHCPVRALAAWLEAAHITSGPLFRRIRRWGWVEPSGLTDQVVTIVVKRLALRAGLEPTQYTAESLRGGFLKNATGHPIRLSKIAPIV